jgi:adenine-specific DNA methylase
MTDTPRLIEVAFPLKQASLDSVHEKNVRHGHISTLHIWPARRPLAACRAALIAMLLPDPGTPEERRKLCEKIGGKVVPKVEKKAMPNGKTVERIKEETQGGILHWKRETQNADDLQWFRDEIRKAYGGRAPKVLDPFAGGGAIPLEAMRLGCEATAIDINPVAWFILKCTLEYPHKLAGQKRPLPEFVRRNRDFMEGFFKAQGIKGAALRKQLEKLGFNGTNGRPAGGQDQKALAGLHFDDHSLDADLAWHIRAWGKWVLDHARCNLAHFYPSYAAFEPLKKSDRQYESRPMQLVPLREDGIADVDRLNGEFDADYLADPRNPQWVAKPTVAYLWARTVKCKNCRATIPLLRTRWLCKKPGKRVLLTIEPRADRTGVDFGILRDVPTRGGNAAQNREHDKQIGMGTTNRSGCWCPCCGRPGVTSMTKEDIQLEGQAGRLSEVPFVAVYEGVAGKGYREITIEDDHSIAAARDALAALLESDHYGPLTERIDPRRPSPNSRGLAGLTKYGINDFAGVFNDRQQLGIMTLVKVVRSLPQAEYAPVDGEWLQAIQDLLSLLVSKLTDYTSRGCTWNLSTQCIGHTFTRYALPMTTDYAESNIVGENSGGFASALDWLSVAVATVSFGGGGHCSVELGSAMDRLNQKFDVILTDPPYYDSIPYSDVSDYFYVWLRRLIGDRYANGFTSSLVDRKNEIIQHAGRLDGDNVRAKEVYEDGMRKAFVASFQSLEENGRFVIVFAHKQPDAWETLVAALIQAGFAVDASWPIQTEREARTVALASAALASSVWLVCKKRPETARPGWDNKVLEEMRANIVQRLRGFWDAGIRGPDFVWAATGPALEAYSKHPVVKKADEPGQVMSVSEFLHHVRRIVVDFVVGRVLSGDGGPHPGPLPEGEGTMADRLDDVTAYYLLHRHDFGFTDAPVGGCILYAISCGLSDSELADTWDIFSRTGGSTADDEDEEEETDPDAEPEADEGSGSKVKLKTWAQRNRKNMGYEAPGGRPVPLIDRLHRLMHLWRAGEAAKVDEYLDDYGLRRHELFRRLLQSLVELSPAGSDERATLESISNHIGAKGAKPKETMPLPGMATDAESEDQ